MRIFLFFLLLPLSLFSMDWTLEVRGAYFRPSSKHLRQIYTDNWIDYQVEASQRFCNRTEFWIGANWLRRRNPIDCKADESYHSHSEVFILPLSAGYKAFFPLSHCLDFYLGGGLAYSFLRIRNGCGHSSACPSSFRKVIHQGDWGGVFKTGFQWNMGSNTFLDVFADYFSQRFRLSRRESLTICSHSLRHLDCSGFKFGLGIGVIF
ncbi:MAG: hypothetical protein LW832_05005 [Parachlamydia sp.]|jgi:outer membrane protein|nr:hypothetical protein [Parachlamydia sp.]